MKLLRKSEVTVLKEREKAREAAEGLKIARKIDELRELQTNTEKKLDDFRDSSLRAVGEEMKILGVQRDTLAAEVSSLRNKLDAMLPGMGTKREELDKKEKDLVILSGSLSLRKDKIDLQEIDVIEAKKGLSDTLARARTDEKLAKQALKRADEADLGASFALLRAKTIEERALRDKAALEELLSQRETVAAQKESELRAKEATLVQERTKLDSEKAKLEDRKRMVERTLERLRAQRINAQ